MFFILSIKFLSTIFVKSPLQDDYNLVRTDCYISCSDPVIYIKLLHKYPSGPGALIADFNYSRYTNLSNHKAEILVYRYYFARYDSICNSSAVFSTMGNDFEKININIKIYLSIDKYKIADIIYNFYKGFMPGIYELVDRNHHFAVQLQIPNSVYTNLGTQKNLLLEFIMYINYISGRKGDLCIVTEHNVNQIVLDPIYGLYDIHGFISAFYGYVLRGTHIIGYNLYPAFFCNKNKYSNQSVTFIVDETADFINFNIYHWKYKDGEPIFFNNKIKIKYPRFRTLNRLEINSIHNKIFLINHILLFDKCSDNSDVVVYLSYDKIKYLAIKTKIITTYNSVEFYLNFYPSPNPLIFVHVNRLITSLKSTINYIWIMKLPNRNKNGY